MYWQRDVIERCITRCKQWRSVATRCEKRALKYRAPVVIVALTLWPGNNLTNSLIPDTPPGLKPHGFSVHPRSLRHESPKALPAP